MLLNFIGCVVIILMFAAFCCLAANSPRLSVSTTGKGGINPANKCGTPLFYGGLIDALTDTEWAKFHHVAISPKLSWTLYDLGYGSMTPRVNIFMPGGAPSIKLTSPKGRKFEVRINEWETRPADYRVIDGVRQSEIGKEQQIRDRELLMMPLYSARR